MRSFSNLNTAVKCALINMNLVNILLTQEGRDILCSVLLDTYFPLTKANFKKSSENLPNASVLNDTTEHYQSRLFELKKQLDINSYQEEIFIRSGIFKREIPKLYNNSCAISGMRVDATLSISMIDACHIVPFSEGKDDTLINGIALCPNLHRAFDRGLISISNDYRVLVNNNFIENIDSPLNIRQFEGEKISLPPDQAKHPSLENLALHRKRFELG